MRIARNLVLVALLSLGLACAGARPPTTSLRIQPAQGAPRDARVVIDDQELGPLWYVIDHGVAMPPGKHRITIEAEYLALKQQGAARAQQVLPDGRQQPCQILLRLGPGDAAVPHQTVEPVELLAGGTGSRHLAGRRGESWLGGRSSEAAAGQQPEQDDGGDERPQ